VYTPAFIVDGKLNAVGADTAAVDRSLQDAAQHGVTATRIDVHSGPSGIAISVGAGAGKGKLLLIGYDSLHRTPVVRGENGGRTLEEANIVRSISALETWSGKPLVFHVAQPAGENVAVILQQEDGQIIGAAFCHVGTSAS
jgi:hypothetical protein